MNISWNVIEQSSGMPLKLMSCLCLPHIFTQMIVMEMIICLSLHIKRREASPQLSVWDANGEMLYGPRHIEGDVMAGYTISPQWSKLTAHSLPVFPGRGL